PFRVHWCPVSGLHGLTRVNSFFQEVESPSTTYRRWSSLSRRNEIDIPYTFPAIEIRHGNWGHDSPPFSANSNLTNVADQASVLPATMRSSRAESDATTRTVSFLHPFPYGHGYVPTGGSLFVSSIVHSGSNARSHERIQVPHSVHRQLGMPSTLIPNVRRFSGPSGMPPVVPAAPVPDHGGGFYIFPPSGSSTRTRPEAENHLPNDFRAWERGHSLHLPLISVGRDAGWESLPRSTSGFDSRNRSDSYWQRHWS
ncbi:unnamed protein product, partial [Ilex paraguariensis]